MLELVVQQTVNGLMMGSIYVLMALGMVLIYGVMHVLNFAHGVLFTLAGYIMSESNMPRRLVRVSRALLGWMPGGLAVVCVFASAFFT